MSSAAFFFREKLPSSRLSATDMSAKILRPSGTMEMPLLMILEGEWAVISWSSYQMCPLLIFTMPMMDFSSVDFPAPLDPSSETSSPWWTSRETPFRALMTP